MRNLSFSRSGILVLGPESIQSLVPATIISQAESLLDSHRIEDAISLADQQRKKLQGKVSVDEDEADELRYVYQRIGFQCFTETRFEDAGQNLFNGDLDPRVLVSYYPELRGSLFSATDSIDVFAGVEERMPSESSVDDIIRNYSPHLSPNTRSAPPTVELRKILGVAAKDMLEVFLRRWRAKNKINESSSGSSSKIKDKGSPVNTVVDTALAKLFAQSEKTIELYTLIREPNDILASDIEPVLIQTGHYSALCMIFKQRGDDNKLLESWAKLIEGEWIDHEINDPLSDMIALLTEKRDRALIQKWGLWITKRAPERGLQLLMSKDSGKRRDKQEDELALLQQIEKANPAAGAQYLEYLVLQRRSSSHDLHMRLASTCIESLFSCLDDDSISKLWRAKASSYASSRNDSSFLSYFASTTPESEHKRIRLQSILFLQGSTLYDFEAIHQQLLGRSKILKLELAILDGKLSNHRSALSTLVHDLRDATSAEAYCTLGGVVVPAKTAQIIGEKYGLQQWSSALFPLSPGSMAVKSGPIRAIPIARQKTVDEGVKKDLLRILLEVYMSDGGAAADRAAHLLNSQAMNLDVVDVITLVPPDWPLNLMSSFLSRSFRRTLHDKHQGQIVKTISAGQNLEVMDRTWLILREHGAIVEEAAEGDDDYSGSYDEKDALAEKIALGSSPGNVHEITVSNDNAKEKSNWVSRSIDMEVDSIS